jgi:hypothetical protein
MTSDEQDMAMNFNINDVATVSITSTGAIIWADGLDDVQTNAGIAILLANGISQEQIDAEQL